jgi:hypothetical protein
MLSKANLLSSAYRHAQSNGEGTPSEVMEKPRGESPIVSSNWREQYNSLETDGKL